MDDVFLSMMDVWCAQASRLSLASQPVFLSLSFPYALGTTAGLGPDMLSIRLENHSGLGPDSCIRVQLP